ncbi:hypothetical protein L6R49_30370, partial [Myxococcota bacterium]|nr:hypothetical protein [Myxococcota bacterium]
MLILALLVPTAMAATWPAATDWVPVTNGSTILSDVCSDVSGSSWWDMVSDTSNHVAYTYFDGTNLFFRLRLADTPYSTSGGKPKAWRSFGWGVMFESDWDYSNLKYDYIVYVDGKSDEVTLSVNSTGSTPYTTDAPETQLNAWSAGLSESTPGSTTTSSAGWQSAGTDVCGTGTGTDYYVDWYVPWATIAAATGAASPDELGVIFGTSASTKTFSKDIAGCDNSTSSCTDYGAIISDSTVDNDGDGLTNTEEIKTYGTDPDVVDT